jgi:hypothetical protein
MRVHDAELRQRAAEMRLKDATANAVTSLVDREASAFEEGVLACHSIIEGLPELSMNESKEMTRAAGRKLFEESLAEGARTLMSAKVAAVWGATVGWVTGASPELADDWITGDDDGVARQYLERKHRRCACARGKVGARKTTTAPRLFRSGSFCVGLFFGLFSSVRCACF